MKEQFGFGFIPYEPGDEVKLKYDDRVYCIKDIRMIQTIVSREIKFEVLLYHGSNFIGWMPVSLVEKRTIPEQ